MTAPWTPRERALRLALKIARPMMNRIDHNVGVYEKELEAEALVDALLADPPPPDPRDAALRLAEDFLAGLKLDMPEKIDERLKYREFQFYDTDIEQIDAALTAIREAGEKQACVVCGRLTGGCCTVSVDTSQPSAAEQRKMGINPHWSGRADDSPRHEPEVPTTEEVIAAAKAALTDSLEVIGVLCVACQMHNVPPRVFAGHGTPARKALVTISAWEASDGRQ